MQDDLSRSVLNLQSEKLELEKQVQWTNNFIWTLVFLLWSCGQQPPTQTFSGLRHASLYAMRATSLNSNILTTDSCNVHDLDDHGGQTGSQNKLGSLYMQLKRHKNTKHCIVQFIAPTQKKNNNKIRRFFPVFTFPCEPYQSFRYVILLDVSPSAHIMTLGCFCHYKMSVNLL